jgi:hypothetical protein
LIFILVASFLWVQKTIQMITATVKPRLARFVYIGDSNN